MKDSSWNLDDKLIKLAIEIASENVLVNPNPLDPDCSKFEKCLWDNVSYKDKIFSFILTQEVHRFGKIFHLSIMPIAGKNGLPVDEPLGDSFVKEVANMILPVGNRLEIPEDLMPIRHMKQFVVQIDPSLQPN